jgi:pimeloyl-ACP methyl ester carboxylesterase
MAGNSFAAAVEIVLTCVVHTGTLSLVQAGGGRWGWVARWCAAAIATVAVVGAFPAMAVAQSADGELIDVGGGRRMYLECHGEGGPTVVFESGYPNDGMVWSAGGVFEAVAGFTRACVYDRPGTLFDEHLARSDAAPQPRTALDVVTDLHALLHAAGEPGPYVFVAHSIGGLFVRLYASTYPGDVAGMVLVDSSSEDQVDRFKQVIPPGLIDSFVFAPQNPPADLMAANPQIERILIEESANQVRTAMAQQPMRPMPLVVLTRGMPSSAEPGLPPGFPTDAYDDVWMQLQRQLAELVPGARQVIATNSGHYIQVSQPDLVIDATRAVVDAVRRGETQLGPGELADTGSPSWILVAVASTLTALGVALRIIASSSPANGRRRTI